MTALDRIEELAKKATPGPWRADGRLVVERNGDAVAMVNIARPVDVAHADSGLIAALSPEVVLAMVEVIRAAIKMGDYTAQASGFDAAISKLEQMK